MDSRIASRSAASAGDIGSCLLTLLRSATVSTTPRCRGHHRAGRSCLPAARAPNIPAHPGTSSLADVRANLAAATLALPSRVLFERGDEAGIAYVAYWARGGMRPPVNHYRGEVW